MARPVSKATVNRQDSGIIVKPIDQSPKSCEFLVQSRVQSTVQSSPESRYCKGPLSVQVVPITDIVKSSISATNIIANLIIGTSLEVTSTLSQVNHQKQKTNVSPLIINTVNKLNLMTQLIQLPVLLTISY